ncbi:MAG: radical SAM family heme chaperone HemW [Lachnospiraceae bacterium]
MNKKEKLSLYIHIPFCVKKCAYCDFLSAPSGRKTQVQYVQALCHEITALGQVYGGKYTLTTIFVGGGTPSILTSEDMKQIFQQIYDSFTVEATAEITVECNPGTLTEEKLMTYKSLGINRLSIGLQSADNEELKRLERIHTWEQFLDTWHLSRKIGFDNINIDLMSALPGQTVSSWKNTLQTVLALKPEHISAYSLIVEEGTPFFERYGEEAEMLQHYGEHQSNFVPYKNAPLPEEDQEREMYTLTETMMTQAGYHRYEISNYAKENRECRHNRHYWLVDNYIGAGLGAASCVDGWRWSNLRSLSKYLQIKSQGKLTAVLTQLQENRQYNTLEEQMDEVMFLGLRMMQGVSKTNFERRFGRSMEQEYNEAIRKNIQKGLLYWRKDEFLTLTLLGINVSNLVMADFLHEE